MNAIAQVRNEQRTRVLIADEHPAAREGLALRLAQEADFVVSGEAGDVPSVFQALAPAPPDLLVLELALRGGSGFDLLKTLRVRCPTMPVLVWSRFRESAYAERAIRAGAGGYIEKTHPTALVVAAIRHVLRGEVFLSPAMTEVFLRQASGKPQGLGPDPLASLSDRELEVFRLIGLCLDTNEIAANLHLSAKTVETYRARIKLKFGTESSAELFKLAVQWDLENGLLSEPGTHGAAPGD
jgi:DNA-binding NarL/FixJ family response regulator